MPRTLPEGRREDHTHHRRLGGSHGRSTDGTERARSGRGQAVRRQVASGHNRTVTADRPPEHRRPGHQVTRNRTSRDLVRAQPSYPHRERHSKPVYVRLLRPHKRHPTSPDVPAGHRPSRPAKNLAGVLPAALHQQTQPGPQHALAGRAGLRDGRHKRQARHGGWIGCGIPPTSPRATARLPGAGL
jgi:hypothetical protein